MLLRCRFGLLRSAWPACLGMLLFVAFFSLKAAKPAPPPAGIPVPANAWTTFRTGGFPAEIVGYDASVYASAIKRHIVLGKYHHYGSESNYCMDGWSWDENRWDILDCGAAWHTEHMMEGGHPVGAFVYMPTRDSILYWGGQSGSNQPEQALHTWWWDVLGRVGRDKISSRRPGLTKVTSMAYDQLHDKVVFFPDAASNVEIYDPTSNTWSAPSVSGTPPPRDLGFSTLEWNSNDHRTYLVGGAIGNNCAGGLIFNRDVYTFDVASRRWSKLALAPDPVNGFPAARKYAGFAYDPVDNIFLVVGGQGCTPGRDSEPVGFKDTWKLDPTAMRWTRLTPAANYILGGPADAPFQKLRYDPDHHAFVIILPSYDNQASIGGAWGNYSARVWVYCYANSCPAVGSIARDYPVPSHSLNRNGGQAITASNQTWASDAAIAADDRKIYAGWIETGLPFAGQTCSFHHPYVQSTDGERWARVGSDCVAMDSSASRVDRDSEKLSLTVVNETVWASWSEPNPWAAGVLAGHWNGSAWIGGPIGTRSPVNVQGFSQLISADGTPTIGFIENNRSLFPDITEAYLDQYKGGAWEALGGKLNHNPSGRVESLAIANGSSGLWACWTEEVISEWSSVRPAQLYCARWDGSRWKEPASSLNNSAADWAADVSIASLNGHVYVAWTERTTAGNAQLYVKVLNGSGGSFLGEQALNLNRKTGWTFHPRLATDASTLFISWEEQQDLGQPVRLYVARWEGNAWLRLGDALNSDLANGSAAHSATTVWRQQPVVIWNESQLGQLQQTYAKRWNGSTWTLLAATGSVAH